MTGQMVLAAAVVAGMVLGVVVWWLWRAAGRRLDAAIRDGLREVELERAARERIRRRLGL